MVVVDITYSGNKKCALRHPEGAAIKTDAPKDIGGDATAFSPTDLVAGALGSCILTTMGMVGERLGVDLSGARAVVEKHMTVPPAPRRLGKLVCTVTLPAGIAVEHRERLERAGHSCPVHASLHPEIDAPIVYVWG